MGSIRRLPSLESGEEVNSTGATNHRMREVTELVARGGIWNSELIDEVSALFDSLAPDWTATRDHPSRNTPLLDALDRGLVSGRVVLELGAGTCISARDLATRFDHLVAADISWEMLSHAIDGAPPLICADGSCLPVADRTIDVLILQNMFLFPAEFDRCLAVDGSIVWVNSRGPATPIHLPTEEILSSLEAATSFNWNADTSTVGEATWAVVRRA